LLFQSLQHDLGYVALISKRLDMRSLAPPIYYSPLNLVICENSGISWSVDDIQHLFPGPAQRESLQPVRSRFPRPFARHAHAKGAADGHK